MVYAEFDIPALDTDLKGLVNGYGHSRNPNFIDRSIAWDVHPEIGPDMLYGIIHPLNTQESIFFEIEYMPEFVIKVRMHIGRMPSITGTPQKVRKAALDYARRMLKSIRA